MKASELISIIKALGAEDKEIKLAIEGYTIDEWSEVNVRITDKAVWLTDDCFYHGGELVTDK